MTPAQDHCETNLSKALTLLLDRLGERPVYTDEVVNDDLTVAHIHRITWQELTDRELVRARYDIGCCRYQLTGSGWREALKLTGQFDTPDFQERFGRLNSVLKSLANGRKEEGLAQTHIVAAQARIPEAWLFNMLESCIWEHEQGRRGAALDDSKTMVVVPIDFNMPLPQLHCSSRDITTRRLPKAGTPNPRRAWLVLIKYAKAFLRRHGRVVLGHESHPERPEESLAEN
jgi:hypothetical protein